MSEDEWPDSPGLAAHQKSVAEISRKYWDWYERQHADPNAPLADWEAPGLTPEERRALIWAAADRDEFEEDPKAAFEEKLRLEALRQERELLVMLGERSLESLPAAVRKLYRQNPNNPSIRALYEATMKEIHERAEDKLRGALLPAVDKMIDLMDCGDEKVELRASTYVFERLAGKTPDVIEHRQDQPFQVVLERVVAGPRVLAERLALPDAGDGPLDAEIVSERISAPRTSQELTERIRAFTDPSVPADEDWAEERAMIRAWKTQS